MTYGVFTLVNGAWKLQPEYPTHAQAAAEAAYLNDVLGATAKVFRR